MALCCRKMVKSSYTAACGVDAILILSAGTTFVNKFEGISSGIRQRAGCRCAIMGLRLTRKDSQFCNRIFLSEKYFSGSFLHCLQVSRQVTLGSVTFGLNLLHSGSTSFSRRHSQKGLPQ